MYIVLTTIFDQLSAFLLSLEILRLPKGKMGIGLGVDDRSIKLPIGKYRCGEF